MDFTREITDLLEWYAKTRDLVIDAEGLDEDASYLQPLHELRYSFDHLMSAIDCARVEDEENAKKYIEEAREHIQRAYSDSIEWIIVTVRDEYEKILKNYKQDIIQEVFPEYYTTIRFELDKARDSVNNYKKYKTINSKQGRVVLENEEKRKQREHIAKIAQEFNASEISEQVRKYYDLLHKKQTELVKAKKARRKTFVMEKIALPILTAIISGVIVAIVTAIQWK